MANEFESVDQSYAQALIELAEQEGQLDQIADEMQQLAELLQSNPELAQLGASRVLTVEERSQMLSRVFKGRVNDLLYRFLLVVNNKNRLDRLSGIGEAFKKLIAVKQGLIEVDAVVATPLAGQDAQSLANRLGQTLGKRVILRHKVDSDLIGGIKLRIEDQLIDGSVVTQLRNIQSQLIAAGQEQARKGLDRVLIES